MKDGCRHEILTQVIYLEREHLSVIIRDMNEDLRVPEERGKGSTRGPRKNFLEEEFELSLEKQIGSQLVDEE